MSTVLWANIRVGDKVSSDERDKWALYKHARKLDRLSRKLELTSFNSICDYTDAKFNVSDEQLPGGIHSTDELMAKSGVWISADDAERLLETLLLYISTQKIRFGWLQNDHDDIVSELQESIAYVQKAKAVAGQFNFSVVM